MIDLEMPSWNTVIYHMRVSENASVESHMPASVRFGRPILLSHLQDPGIPMSSISGTCPKSMGRSPTFFLKFFPTTIFVEAKIESRCWNPKNCERSLSYHLRSHPVPPFYGCKIWCFWNIRDFCVFPERLGEGRFLGAVSPSSLTWLAWFKLLNLNLLDLTCLTWTCLTKTFLTWLSWLDLGKLLTWSA